MVQFSAVIERLDKSLIGLDKDFAPSFRKHPDKLSRPAAYETLLAFKIVRNRTDRTKTVRNRNKLLKTDAKFK